MRNLTLLSIPLLSYIIEKYNVDASRVTVNAENRIISVCVAGVTSEIGTIEAVTTDMRRNSIKAVA